MRWPAARRRRIEACSHAARTDVATLAEADPLPRKGVEARLAEEEEVRWVLAFGRLFDPERSRFAESSRDCGQ